MKKLITIILLLFAVNVFGQGITTQNSGVNTGTTYRWTVPQYFSTLIADLIITNRVDSTQSIRLYDTSGTLYALFSADTSYIPNLTVGNLNSSTIINGTSVTTNSLISDTIISNSPLFLRSDSIYFGLLNDTSKVWYREITTANSTRGSIYPNINLGSDLGLTTNKFRNIRGRTLNVDSVLIGGYYINSCGGMINVYSLRLGEINYGGAVSTSKSGTGLLDQYIATYNNQYRIYDKYVNSTTNFRRLNIGWTADSTAVISTENAGQYGARGLTLKMGTLTEPTSPIAGQIYFNGTNFFGYNGTIWKQLDN